ncbi:MAG: response regulator, partial [Gammaproteobacteria bacterium]|nr:response regulator [Gammaproteobacteria bacterium]
ISVTRDGAAEAVDLYASSPDDPGLSADAMESAIALVETVSMAAENAEFPGLYHLANLLLDHLHAISADIHKFPPDYARSIVDWANRVLVYLRRPQTPDERLLIPLPEKEREGVLELLVFIPEAVKSDDTQKSTDNGDEESSSVSDELMDISINDNENDKGIENNFITEAIEDNNESPISAGPESLDFGHLLTEPSSENSADEEPGSLGEPGISDEITIDSSAILEEMMLVSEDLTGSDNELSSHTELDAALINELPSENIELETSPGDESSIGGVELDLSLVEDSSGLSGADDMLEILHQELSTFFAELAPLPEVISGSKDTGKLTEAIINYSDVLDRLYSATDMLGFSGLANICEFINKNIQTLADADEDTRAPFKNILETWPNLVLDFIKTPDDDKKCAELVNLLQNTQWPVPLGDEQTLVLIDELITTLDMSDVMAEGDQRKTIAEPNDVTLIISTTVDSKLADAFLQESPEHAVEFSTCIGRISSGDNISENVSAAQRHAHTLKGIASMVGVNGVANLAHHLEDILDYLIKHNTSPPVALADVLQEAADCIEIMVDSLLGKDQPPTDALRVLQGVIDWAIKIDAGQLKDDGPPAADTVEIAEASPSATSIAEEKLVETPAAVPAAAVEMLRVPVHTVDEIFRLVGEMSIALGQIQEQVRGGILQGKQLHQHDNYLQQKRYELQDLVDIRSISNRHRQSGSGAATDEFDSLELDEYDELYGATHMFIEAVVDTKEMTSELHKGLTDIDEMLNRQLRLNKELQEYVTTTRMVPVNTIEARLQRNVRQACRATDKKATLLIKGGDLLVDSDVLHRLTEPLMHMLRNAVDHGIEDPESRVAYGKSDVGAIELEFSRLGNTLSVKCADDGQGLDYGQIYESAVAKGLYPGGKHSDDIDKRELARLILTPRFSTRSVVTKTSGRGVGMDVVHKAIKDLKGVMDIGDNTPCGCLIMLQLPITLITSHSVIVQEGKEIYAIPTNTLEQILAPDTGHFSVNGDEASYQLGEEIYPAYSLSSMLRMPTDVSTRFNSHKSVLLARGDAGTVAIAVDKMINSYELVIKGMGRFVRPVQGVTGTSVLRTGDVVTVLDIQELLRIPPDVEFGSGHDVAMIEEAAELAQVLIVDDSLSVRNSLAQLVSDEGYEPHLARDGMEAMDMLLKHKPALVLTDLEMPRMNGLELAAQIRASSGLSDLPIVMITSRTQQKHREQAEKAGVSLYITKPYAEDDLIEAMHTMINEG